MTEQEFIQELVRLGKELGEAAANAALAHALGLRYEDALEVERRNAEKRGKA